MTKKAIIEDLHDRMNGVVRKQQIQAVYDEIVDQVISTLKQGDSYRLGDLGTFRPAETSAREGVSPRTGEKMTIPARTKISFKAGSVAKRQVNEQ